MYVATRRFSETHISSSLLSCECAILLNTIRDDRKKATIHPVTKVRQNAQHAR
jgi:hypothetical protein